MDFEQGDTVSEYVPIQTEWRKLHAGELAMLNRQIDEFLKLNDRGYVQGSSEWKEVRGKTIGGSEQATLEGRNPYATCVDLIKSKLGLKPFEGGIATRWGNLFEEIIVDFVQRDLNTTIKATEAFLKGRFPTQSYSPDGIGVVGYHATKGVCEDEDAEPTLVLFEFKCPFRRQLKGIIPDHYLPQIYAGMDTIGITTHAVFAEAMFRRCSWPELGDNSKYDFATWNYDSIRNCKPIAYGFVVFKFSTRGIKNTDHLFALKSLAALFRKEQFEVYTTNPSNVNSLFSSTTEKSRIVDAGSCPMDVLEKMFELYGDGVLEAIYSPIVYTETKNLKFNTTNSIEDDYNRIIDNATAQSDVIFGLFPYKLFKIGYNYRERAPGYLDQWRPKIEEIMGIVLRCRENPSEQAHILSQYFTSTGRPTDDICTLDSDEIFDKKSSVITNTDLLEKLKKAQRSPKK